MIMFRIMTSQGGLQVSAFTTENLYHHKFKEMFPKWSRNLYSGSSTVRAVLHKGDKVQEAFDAMLENLDLA
jgi:hypothetical protein